MKLRFSLFTRILLWFFFNLIVLVVVHFLLFNLQFRFIPFSSLIGDPGNQIEIVARQIGFEIRGLSPEARSQVFERYSGTYNVEFLLYDNTGKRLAGREISLPSAVLEKIRESDGPGPGRSPGHPPFEGGPPGRRQAFMVRTTNPSRYWAGVRIPVFEPGTQFPTRSTLVASSDSITGHGLFFNPVPFLVIIGLVLSISFLLWFPFVRRITRKVKEMTLATEKIADEKFDIRVDEDRTDELGRLASAINHLAGRLAGFVSGQKRFLGDVSHELNSPLARMQVALSILEERIDPAQKSYVADAQEEVRLMTRLVGELLTYTKAGMTKSEVKLQNVNLKEVIEKASEREDVIGKVISNITEDQWVYAQPELLNRAIANVLRNAVRYAGEGEVIRIDALRVKERVIISISDNGPGVPVESLDRLFDPFYRVESDRGRSTGGTGLGLAIVKSCVEACQGTVSAKNRVPHGLEIQISLSSA